MSWGDVKLGDTRDFKFNTSLAGVPTTIAGSPVLAAYVGNGTTEITTGITLTTDFDGRVGLHNIRVVVTGGNGYATGTDVTMVFTAGTLGGSTLVSLSPGEFSIEARTAINVTLAASAVQAIWDAAVSSLTTVGSIGKRLVDYITGDIYARLGAPAGASHAADVAAVKVDSAAIKVQTDKLTFTVANQIDANVLDWKSATAPAMTGDAFARLGAPAGASVSADVAAAKGDTASIKTVTDALPNSGALTSLASAASLAIVASYIDTEVQAIKAKTDNLPAAPAAVGDIPTAAAIADAVYDESTSGHTVSGSYGDKLGAHLKGVIKVVIGVGSSTTSIVLDGSTGVDGGAPSLVNDFYNGRTIVFTSGALAGQATDITDYVASTVTLTVTALTGGPIAGVTAVIV